METLKLKMDSNLRQSWAKNKKQKEIFKTYDEKVKFIIDNYKLMTAKEIANIVSFNLTSVQRIAWRNNVYKNKEYVDDIKNFILSKILINT